MKKQMFVAGIATIAALSSLVILGVSSNVDAANQGPTTTTHQGKGFGFGGRQGKGHGIGMEGKGMGMMQGFDMGVPGRDFHGNEALQTAVKNNDYNAFVTAWNADVQHPTNATVPTQDQFTKMVTYMKKEVAINAAIEVNDYNAFVEATKPTQEEFNDIVAKHAEQKAVEAAIKSNNYTAFQTAIASTPEAGKVTQAQFTKIVDRYNKKIAPSQQQ